MGVNDMPHYYLEGLENEWNLIRETPSSQKYRVKTPDEYEMGIDVHYTISKILTVNICFVGSEKNLSKAILTPVMEDLSKIALKKADYAVIDYTLAHTENLFDGNYSIDKKTREVFQKTL